MDATQARKFYEQCLATLYVRREVERMADYYAADVISHPDIPGVPPGIAGLQLTTGAFLGSFSEINVHVDAFTQDGDAFCCQLHAEATHSGEFLGVAATGKRVKIVAQQRFRPQAGKIVEFWSHADPSLVLRQLGASQAA